jgi:photosystem I P700 chlorophyll a apoprotein A2
MQPVEAFTRGGASGPVILLHLVYQWWYTIGMRSNQDLYIGSIFFSTRGDSVSFRWLASPPTKFQPGLSWFKMQQIKSSFIRFIWL